MNFLEDPAWNGIQGIATLIALIIAIKQDHSLHPIAIKIIIGLLKATIGVLLISTGPIIYHGLVNLLILGGVPAVVRFWKSILSSEFGGLSHIVGMSLSYALFPGSVTAIFASMSKRLLPSMVIAVIVTFLSTTLYDIVHSFLVATQASDTLLLGFFFNIIGSIIIGSIIALCIKAFDSIIGIH